MMPPCGCCRRAWRSAVLQESADSILPRILLPPPPNARRKLSWTTSLTVTRCRRVVLCSDSRCTSARPAPDRCRSGRTACTQTGESWIWIGRPAAEIYFISLAAGMLDEASNPYLNYLSSPASLPDDSTRRSDYETLLRIPAVLPTHRRAAHSQEILQPHNSKLVYPRCPQPPAQCPLLYGDVYLTENEPPLNSM